jgi:uroporphyrinogen decarboxylase
MKHTDGNIWSICDMIVESGIDCLGPLEPGANMDLYEVKKKYGDRICVLGNVDVDLLSRGSKEDVINSTKGLIQRVGPGGGYILSSGNSISSSVKPENFIAMVETAKRYGYY